MEPIRSDDPLPGFLEGVRQIASQIGAVLVFDEVSAGFRLNSGGAHLLFGVTPDIAVFAKAISNGYPMGAIIGRRDVMEAAQQTFISSTSWTERIGPAAALATIKKHRREQVGNHLVSIGTSVLTGWRRAAERAGLSIEAGGIPPMGHFSFTYANGQAIRTLFTQHMLDCGYLATGAFYATFAHRSGHVESYLEAVEEVFSLLAEAVAGGSVERQLRGAVAHSGFYRLT